MNTNFIKSEREYCHVISLRNRIYNNEGFTEGLPVQVFKSKFNKYIFAEFDLMLRKEFWRVLRYCAEIAGDSDIYLLSIEPDADTYFMRYFRRYGALHFTRESTETDYHESLLDVPGDSPADTLQFNTGTITWFGNTGEWAFWGERSLCVGIGTSVLPGIDWTRIRGFNFHDINFALNDLISLCFLPSAIPIEFRKKFQANYGFTI